MDEVLRHPVVVGVLVVLMAGVIVSIVRFQFRTAKTLDKLDEFILPHFLPPKPGEEDTSLPGQVRDLKDETVKVRGELRDHMHVEEREREIAATEATRHRSLLRKVARAVGLDPDA